MQERAAQMQPGVIAGASRNSAHASSPDSLLDVDLQRVARLPVYRESDPHFAAACQRGGHGHVYLIQSSVLQLSAGVVDRDSDAADITGDVAECAAAANSGSIQHQDKVTASWSEIQWD